MCAKSSLEFDPESSLTGAVARIFRRLRGRKHTKRARIVDVRSWRRIVRMVQHVSEGRFEAYAPLLPIDEDLGKASADSDCAGRFKASNAGVADPASASRSVREGPDVEVIAWRTMRRNRIANPVWPNNRSIPRGVRVGLVIGDAVGWGQIRPGFEQRDGIHIPIA
jgi:hypothetical protein